MLCATVCLKCFLYNIIAILLNKFLCCSFSFPLPGFLPFPT
jgi:hypothetical protein